jgi:hypothetical protein
VWSHVPPAGVEYPWVIKEENKPSEEELKRRDAWRAIFMPQGAILAGRVDDRSWLTSGCGAYVPIVFQGDTVMLTPVGIEAPVRLGAIEPSPTPEPIKSPAAAPVTPASPEPKADPKPGTPAPATPETLPGWSIAPPGHELRLRMSGLLWPEASERLAHAAYVTREQVGSGQVILFASSPTFRAAAKGTARIFSNAVVFGPGMGADKVIRP